MQKRPYFLRLKKRNTGLYVRSNLFTSMEEMIDSFFVKIVQTTQGKQHEQFNESNLYITAFAVTAEVLITRQQYYFYQYFILPLYLNPQFWTKWHWDQNLHCRQDRSSDRSNSLLLSLIYYDTAEKQRRTGVKFSQNYLRH